MLSPFQSCIVISHFLPKIDVFLFGLCSLWVWPRLYIWTWAWNYSLKPGRSTSECALKSVAPSHLKSTNHLQFCVKGQGLMSLSFVHDQKGLSRASNLSCYEFMITLIVVLSRWWCFTVLLVFWLLWSFDRSSVMFPESQREWYK